jgi:hypothetical protein
LIDLGIREIIICTGKLLFAQGNYYLHHLERVIDLCIRHRLAFGAQDPLDRKEIIICTGKLLFAQGNYSLHREIIIYTTSTVSRSARKTRS